MAEQARIYETTLWFIWNYSQATKQPNSEKCRNISTSNTHQTRI